MSHNPKTKGPIENQKPPLDKISWVKFNGNPELPTVIFLHDSLGCIQLWRDFPKKLGSLTNCNIIVYDRQGYGASCPFVSMERGNDYLEIEADILIDLMEFWNIENSVLFGHSDGGSIALLTAAKYPEKIKGIVTEGAHVFVEEITLKGIRKVVKRYQTSNLKSRLIKYHGEKTDDMFWAWAATWTKKEFRTWNIESWLPRIECPSLVIQGQKDEFGTIAQVDSIVNNTKGPVARLLIPDARHTPHKEVPEILLRQTSTFIDQIVST